MNKANQLFFTYWGLVPKLQVFVLLRIESIRVADFLYMFKEKQEVWHKIMTAPASSYRYYNPA